MQLFVFGQAQTFLHCQQARGSALSSDLSRIFPCEAPAAQELAAQNEM